MSEEEKNIYITHLQKVKIEGYKSIDKLEIDLVPGLNIIIGKNASGKSNFLECLYEILDGVSSPSFIYSEITFVDSEHNNYKWISERNLENESLEYNQANSLRNEIFLQEQENLPQNKFVKNGKVIYSTFRNKFKDEKLEKENRTKIIYYSLYEILAHHDIFRFHSVFIHYNLPKNLIFLQNPGTIELEKRKNLLIQRGIINELFFREIIQFRHNLIERYINNKEIQFSKEELLSYLILKSNLKSKLSKYTPIKDIRFSENINIYEDEKHIKIENIYVEFEINDKWMPWSNLSDGTKRLFYLIKEVTSWESGIVLIEEPELGIHPHQFFEIMNFLKEEAKEKQIIITTHSPQALNILSEDELDNIIISKYHNTKGTQLYHLTSRQKEKAKRYMKDVGFLSDYWMHSDLES